MTIIAQIESIGPAFSEKLSITGITTVEKLLDRGATPIGRKQIANDTGIDSGKILQWVNMADLFRITGIGEEYSDLLQAAGINSTAELARQHPARLHNKLTDTNNTNNPIRQPPSEAQVEKWISEAKHLPRIVNY